jgi:hypothetical protein
MGELSEFGVVYKKALEVTGVTTEHISEVTGYNRTTIWKYTVGKVEPQTRRLRNIARAMLLPPGLFEVPVSMALKMLKRLALGEIQPQWDTGWLEPETAAPRTSGAKRAQKRRVPEKKLPLKRKKKLESG